jgi:hypothetical protein
MFTGCSGLRRRDVGHGRKISLNSPVMPSVKGSDLPPGNALGLM